jgi:hypothetical protein
MGTNLTIDINIYSYLNDTIKNFFQLFIEKTSNTKRKFKIFIFFK